MSNVKERIIGAVTIMSEEEAEKVWNLIQASFILSDVEEIELTVSFKKIRGLHLTALLF